MTSEQRPDIQLGTGSPRSELASDVAEPTGDPDATGHTAIDPSDTLRVGRSGETTLGAESDPALPDDIEPNRSGSGGSGGPMGEDADPSEEGSTGQSMDDLLASETP